MIPLKSLLAHLSRSDVTEVILTSGRSPIARVYGGSEPISPATLSTDVILQLLVGAGGSRHVDLLGPRPTQWATRAEGVGPIAVSAVMLGDDVQATFTMRRAAGPSASPAALTAADLVTHDRGTSPPSSSTQQGIDSSVPPPPPSSQPHAFERTAPSSVSPIAADRGAATRSPTVRERRPGIPTRSSEPEPSPQTRPSAVPARERTTAPQRVLHREDIPFELDLEDPRPAALPPPPAVPTATRAPETIATLTPRSPDAHPRVFSELLRGARDSGTSDLHLIAGRRPMIRVSGELVSRGEPLEPKVVEQMMLARLPQRLHATFARDGSADFAHEEPGLGRFRVNVTRQRTGIKAAFRLIPREIPTLATLGLPDAIAAATHHHQGLIVLTGPTGHGKTTTLAAVVDILNRDTLHHIITVEDPIELVHPRKRAMMSQREVGTHTRSFHSALKASLREDPDVIVVGELRDTETVRMALSAAETGHLVIGTMNTPSAAKTIDRLIDLFPPGEQAQVRITLAGALRLVVSQRLLPNEARTGMVAAAEVLPGLPALWNLIRDNKTYQIPSLQQRGRGLGIVRLDDSLADLVRAGKVAVADALAVAEAREELDAVLSGRRANPAPVPPPSRPEAPPEPVGKSIMDRAGALFGRKGGS